MISHKLIMQLLLFSVFQQLRTRGPQESTKIDLGLSRHQWLQGCLALTIANSAAELLAGTVRSETDPDRCSASVLPCEELQEAYSVMTTGVKITRKRESMPYSVNTNISETKLYCGNIKTVNACTSRFMYR